MLENISEILTKAGDLALSMQKPDLLRLSKGGADFATEADLRVQELIYAELKEKFPGISVLGEEDAKHDLDLSETFIVDPIDGTFDFAYGGEEWGVMISYFKNGNVVYSGVTQPRLGNVLLSGCEEGSYLNGTKVTSIESPVSIEESILIQCLGNWLSEGYYEQVLLPSIKKARIVRSFSSAVNVLMQLAKGHGHCFIGDGGKVWDYAPVSLLIKTLNGVESDFSGNALIWKPERMQVVYSLTKEYHSKILNYLKAE